ncbi:hypothetical protein ACE6H2_020640 [Prunus campanulata]
MQQSKQSKSFNQRLSTVMRKAAHLAKLCKAQVCVVAYNGPNAKVKKNYELRDNSFQLGFANCSNNGTMTRLADQIVSAGTSDYSSSTGEWGMQSQVFVQKKMLLRWDRRSEEAILDQHKSMALRKAESFGHGDTETE